MKFDLQSLDHCGGIQIRIESESLDAGNSNEFKQMITPHLESHRLVIIDLSTLDFVDSSGLGALLSCLRATNNKGNQLKLIGLTKPVRALFELVRMHRIFSIYNSQAEAIASI